MNRFEEGLRLIEESCGNGKDNIIALATLALDVSNEGKPYPFVREVDAIYEDGVFYITTWGKSNKILQIANNSEVSLVVCQEGITVRGKGINLGWVLEPKNAEIRSKLRTAFSKWYDHANKEEDENCVILAVKAEKATIFRNEGNTVYELDFINQSET